MSIRRLTIWALIFFGLLAYVLAFEKPAPKPLKPSPRGDYDKAFGLSQSEISAITITQPEKSVTISAKNLKWQVTDPAGAEALPSSARAWFPR